MWYLSNGFKQRSIEGSRRQDDLREAGGTRNHIWKFRPWTNVRDTVQSLRPPLILWNPKPGHISSIVDKKPNLLLQCQPLHQILHSRLKPEWWITEGEPRHGWIGFCIAGKRGGRLGRGSGAEREREKKKEEEGECKKREEVSEGWGGGHGKLNGCHGNEWGGEEV